MDQEPLQTLPQRAEEECRLPRPAPPDKPCLCQTCNRPIPRPEPGRSWKLSYGSVVEIDGASRDGCSLCTAFFFGFKLNTRQLQHDSDVQVPVEISLAWKTNDTIQATINRGPSQGCSIKLAMDLNPGCALDQPGLWMGATYKHLISDCATSKGLTPHKCPSNEEVILPHRLLDVDSSESQRVKLVVFNAEHQDKDKSLGKYVALSYCWGRSVPFTTTPETLPDRVEGINIQSMPRTLRHAIEVTRQLGVKYLWVDSLCILQGKSQEATADWERESSLMHEIYGNAFVTIAALSARDSEGGLLDPVMWMHLPLETQDGEQVSTRTDDFGWREHEMQTESVEYCSFYLPEPLKGFKDEPLNSRGWAFQEWTLSTRILSFASTETFVHCTENPLRGNFHRVYRHRMNPDKIDDPECREWRMLLEHYASRSVSVDTDKLVAFSAIAKRYDELTLSVNQGYRAGLWEKTLVQDLLWRRDDGIFHTQYADRQVKPKTTGRYRAPTWSWASNDGIISYMARHHPVGGKYVARKIKCITQPSTSDRFAGVKSAELTIKAPFTGFSAETLSQFSVMYDHLGNNGGELPEVKPGEITYCALIKTHKQDGDPDYGLLLRGLGTCYERVGLVGFVGKEKQHWKGCVAAEITIL